MAYYIFIFIFCVFMYVLHKNTDNLKVRKIIEIVTIFILIIFSGTRYRIGGSDYEMYENMFKSAPTISKFTFFKNYIYGVESGYILLNSIVKSIGLNFYGFTLIHSILFYILLYKSLQKYNINNMFFIVIFLYKCWIFNTFISMRQSLVIVVFLNALYYLINNNWQRYLAYLIPCILLHRSTVILLPIILICNKNYSKKTMVVYGLVFIFFFLLNITNVYIFNPSTIIYNLFGSFIKIVDKTEFYLKGSALKSINVFSTIETYMIWLALVIFYKKLYKNACNEQKRIINVFLLTIPLVTLFRSFEVMIRFRDYFSILFPFLIYYVSEIFDIKSQKIYNFLIFLLSFLGLYRYVYSYGTGKYSLVDYSSYIIRGERIIEYRN